MKALKTLIVLVILLTGVTTFKSSAQAVTNIDLPGLKNTFNTLQGTTRLVFIGDPTCPNCIISANDLRIYIFNVCTNSNLRGLIVWVHMAGYPSTLNDAITQSSGWSDPRITCYWDSLWDISYAFGYQGGWAGCNWAWDISMIYTDSATWTGAYPNAPYHCMSKTGCCSSWNTINQRNQLIALGECYNTTGMNENFSSQSGLSVFPNPAEGLITFNLSEAQKNGETEITIFNTLGESFMEMINQNSLDVSGLKPGLYFLRIRKENKFGSAKFIKE